MTELNNFLVKEARRRGEKRADEMWAKGGEQVERTIWRDPVDVTAWGEAEPKFLSNDGLIRLPDRNEAVMVAYSFIRRACLEAVFDEAARTSMYIVWLNNLPTIGNTSSPLKRMLEYMLDIWDELPVYIEVEKPPGDRFRYSIKPVWEL